jgi:DNA-binding XRE family transcriptional regulator
MMNAHQVIRRARQQLGLSQEALARALNATKGAVQHWERGRNSPDLARLLALHRLCPKGRVQMQLDALIRRTGVRATPPSGAAPIRVPQTGRSGLHPAGSSSNSAEENLSQLRRENARLQQRVKRLETITRKRNVQLRILQDLAEELHRELISLRAIVTPTGVTTGGRDS